MLPPGAKQKCSYNFDKRLTKLNISFLFEYALMLTGEKKNPNNSIYDALVQETNKKYLRYSPAYIKGEFRWLNYETTAQCFGWKWNEIAPDCDQVLLPHPHQDVLLMTSVPKPLCAYKCDARLCWRSAMMQHGAKRRFCCNERWTYLKGRGAANKSPDPPVTQVDISFVPLHFLYQRAFLQMSEGWKISQPITVHCCPWRQHQGEFALRGSYRNDSRGRGGGVVDQPSITVFKLRRCGRIAGEQRPAASRLQPFPAAVSLCLFLLCSAFPSDCSEARQPVL